MCTQVAASREVLLGKQDLPKSALPPSCTHVLPGCSPSGPVLLILADVVESPRCSADSFFPALPSNNVA
jgi:hypothetical protein